MRVLSSVFVLCALALARPTAAGRRVEEKKRRKEREAAAAAATDERGLTKAQGPPAFFLQDPNDATCMSGKEFRRCAIDNLWQVVGKAGAYKITLRKSDEDQDEQCLDAVSCDGDEADVRLGSCKHCGAAEWNIHGDKESGYVLSRGGTSCLGREPGGKAAKMVPCAEADRVVYMALQFAGKSDLEAMESVGARLITAASDGDKRSVKQFLKDGVDVNSRDWDKTSSMSAAAQAGHFDVVKMLFQAGADVDAQDKDQITALMEASITGNFQIAEYLVKNGADVNMVAASGVGAVWLACGEGHTKVASMLLSNGADPQNVRMDGITALMAAAVGGHPETTAALLKAGADLAPIDHEGLDALMNGAENGTVAVVKALLDAGAEPNSVSEMGFTPLIIAAAGGHKDATGVLLEAGADIAAKHPDGVDALMYAAAGGHTGIVELLIAKGAVVDEKHNNGGTALMEAATAGSVEVIKLLQKHGADVNVLDRDTVSPLMSAASQGQYEATEYLIGQGNDVNKMAATGGTALMFAANAGHANVTELLLKHKADLDARVHATPEYIEREAAKIAAGDSTVEPHKDGVTALMLASLNGYKEVVRILLKAGAKVALRDEGDESALTNAVAGNYGDIAFELVEAGADPDDTYTDDAGTLHNLLWDAVAVGNEKFAKLLATKGASTEATDTSGVTPLINAAHRGYVDSALALLQAGANVTAHNDELITPLIAAANGGHIDIVTQLVAHEAPINWLDKDGTSALMASSIRGYIDVLNVLVEAGADVNIQNDDGHTALFFAYNSRAQVGQLLDKYISMTATNGAEEDEAVEKDDAAAEAANIFRQAFDNHTKCTQTLIKVGADVSLKDKEGRIAIDFDYSPKDVLMAAVGEEALADAAASAAKAKRGSGKTEF